MPMRKGWSGARIEIQESRVVKHGERVYTQAAYCRYLGTNVCPEIYDFTKEWYSMERLQEPDPGLYLAIFHAIKATLVSEVWNKGEPRNGDSWRAELLDFAFGMGFKVGRFLDRLYPEKELHGCIHGDPTLSNAMMRPPGRVILIDPIKPMGKIPGFREVDIGKMLQSAIGWETQTMGWEIDSTMSLDIIFEGENNLTIQRAWFWCAVHLMRILAHGPYNPVDNVVDEWCRDRAANILLRLDGKI